MKNLLIHIVLSSFLLLLTFSATSAQIFLQIEKKNTPKSIRLQAGDYLVYTLKAYPDIWRTERITSLDYDQSLIVLEEGYYKLDEIAKIRLYRNWSQSVSFGMLQFSAGWFLYGGIASLASSEYTMSDREIIIGGIFAAVGFLIRKIFYKKTLSLGEKHRLRIVDIRLFIPENPQDFAPIKN